MASLYLVPHQCWKTVCACIVCYCVELTFSLLYTVKFSLMFIAGLFETVKASQAVFTDLSHRVVSWKVNVVEILYVYVDMAVGCCTTWLWQDIPGYGSSRCKSSGTRLPTPRHAVTSAGCSLSVCLSVCLYLPLFLSVFTSVPVYLLLAPTDICFYSADYKCSYLLHSLFGSKVGFSRLLDSLYGSFWRCSCILL